MRKSLGPGGRYLVVALGLFVIYAALDRAGVIRDPLPHLFPPREKPAPAAAPARPVLADDFAWIPTPIDPGSGLGCKAPLTVATTERVAAIRLTELRTPGTQPPGPLFRLAAVTTGRNALYQVISREADVAVVSLSELFAAYGDLGEGKVRIVGILAGTSRDLVVAAPDSIRVTAELTGKKAAAVPGSAAEYLLLGTLAHAGVLDRVTIVPAATTQEALRLLASGEVQAAAAPLALVQQMNQEGKAIVLPSVPPADPIVLVMSTEGACSPGSLAALLACPLPEGLTQANLEFDQRAGQLFGTPALSFREALKATRFAWTPLEVLSAWDAAARVRAKQGLAPAISFAQALATIQPGVLDATCPAPVAPPGPQGSLTIVAKPYASVFVNGEAIGNTPLAAKSLPVGVHRIKLVNSDLQIEKSLNVEIRAGESTKLSVDLTAGN